MKKEYLRKIIQTELRTYLFFLCAVFPLYIANRKYDLLIYYKKDLLYRSSAIFAVISFILVLAVLITDFNMVRSRISFTGFDTLMGVAFLAVFVSYLNTIDSYQALNGAPGWFMGVKTYLILLFIYLMYSFFFHWHKWDILLCFSGPFLVLLLAVLNRFGLWFLNPEHIDPMYISTIGNINWMNAFTAVILPAGAGFYVSGTAKHKITDVCWIVFLIIGWLSILTNGSDAVYLWFAAASVFLVCYGFSSDEAMQRVLNCFILFGISGCFLVILQKLRPDIRANYLFQNATSISGRITRSWAWLIATAVLIILKFTVRKMIHITINTNKWLRILFLAGAAGTVLLLLVQITGIPSIPDSFGTGRGYLWRLSRGLFSGLTVRQKLFGVGPDCFGRYSLNDWDFMMALMEMFPGSHTTNTHSEPLTMLFNLGFFGTGTYLMALIYGMLSLLKTNSSCILPLLLGVVSCTVNQLVAFQLIVSTPYLYLILAFAGYLIRIHAPVKPAAETEAAPVQTKNRAKKRHSKKKKR